MVYDDNADRLEAVSLRIAEDRSALIEAAQWILVAPFAQNVGAETVSGRALHQLRAAIAKAIAA